MKSWSRFLLATVVLAFLPQNIGSQDQSPDSRDLLGSPRNGNWLTYHGDYGANRFSPLNKINTGNAHRLDVRWTYRIGPGKSNLRSSPIIFRGVMYVTGSNEVHAVNVATGTRLWVWKAKDEPTDMVNRGVAIRGNKLFFATSDCYLVALDRFSGNVIWSKQFARPTDGYFSTMAPLVIGEKIVVGISNMNSGPRGFVAAFSGSDGNELWRFWAAPVGLRGAPTWMTGSFDPLLNRLYWAVGSLRIGSRRPFGVTDVYDNSVVALNPENGRAIWATRLGEDMPDDWWDANEPLVLSDLRIGGSTRKVILQAHRNGLFFVIDRTNGKILLSKPFIEKVNWSRNEACPSMWGATNWMSPSFSSMTNLFYVMVHEGCMNKPNRFHIRALEPSSGNIVWDYPTRGPNEVSAGVLSTAGNLVVSGEGSGHIVILDARNGKLLRDFDAGKPTFSSPVTFLSRGEQLISVVAGSEVITLGLYKNP